MNKLIIVPVNLSSTKYVNFANLHFILSFQIKSFYYYNISYVKKAYHSVQPPLFLIGDVNFSKGFVCWGGVPRFAK